MKNKNEKCTIDEDKEFDKSIESMVGLFKELNKLNKREIANISDLVDEIIRYKYNDTNKIGLVFDRMLSIEFIEEDDIKEPYYKLINYAKKIDPELSKDYEKFFIEKFSEDDEDVDFE